MSVSFDAELVQQALTRSKKSNPRAEVVPGVISQRIAELEASFEALKTAGIHAQRALNRKSIPERYTLNVGHKVIFNIKADSCETVFSVIAEFAPIRSSVNANVVVRYVRQCGDNDIIEARLKLRPWHDYDENWKIKRIDALPDKDMPSKTLVATLKATEAKGYDITMVEGYTVKTSGRNLMEVISRNVFWHLLDKKKPKKTK